MNAMCTAALRKSATISLRAVVLELWSLHNHARRRSVTSYVPRRRAPDAKWLPKSEAPPPSRHLPNGSVNERLMSKAI